MATEESDYILKSEQESSRLANQHDVIKDEMGSLVLAPIVLSKPLRILDSATADGTWIRDLASSTAPIEHQFVGTDLDASNFPANPDKNQTYFAQDINKPWPDEWKESFDFVHQRLALVACGPAVQQSITNLGTLVKPGGWIQLIEATFVQPEENGPIMRNFNTLMQSILKTFGASLSLGNDLPGLVEAAGFEDVQSRIANTRLGAKNSNSELGSQGIYSMKIASAGLAKFGSTIPEGEIPLSAAQIESIPADLETELAKRGAVFQLRVVWGRKPMV